MKQVFLTSILMAAALAFVAGPAAAQPKEVKFGCYAPLTGQLAIFGKSMQQGFEMAIDEFAKTPQSKGIKFTIQCEDDQGRADDGINIARKFVEDRSVLAVLGSWASTVTLAAGPVYNQGKLVNITPISSHPDVTKVGPYVFRQSLVQSQEGAFNGATWEARCEEHRDDRHSQRLRQGEHVAHPRGFESKAARWCSRSTCGPMPRIFASRCRRRARGARLDLYRRLRAADCLMLKQLRQMGIKTRSSSRRRRHARSGPARRDRGDRRNARDGADQPGLGPELADF